MACLLNETWVPHQYLQIQAVRADYGTVAHAMNVAKLAVVDALGKGAAIFVLMSTEENPLTILYPHPYLEEAKVEPRRLPVAKEASIGCGELLIDAVAATQPLSCSSYFRNLKFLLLM